jgi:hypothetical protein
MLPAYQNGALNRDLVIKNQLVQQQKRAYSVVQDVQLIQDTGLASQLTSTIQTNLVVLNSLLGESLAYFSATSFNALDVNETGDIQQSIIRPSLAGNLRQILISANTLKQNVSKLQPVINYVSRADIEGFINQLNDLDDRYTEIFLTAGDVIDGLDDIDQENLTNFLNEVQKTINPIHITFRALIKNYSPQIASVPLPSPGRNLQDGGYSLAGSMNGGYFEKPYH